MKTPARRLGAVVCAGLLAVASLAGIAHAASKVPYTDPSADGYLSLCDSSGHAVTQGSIATTPFVWNAVSSVAAPSSYDVDGATATLYAYQPRENVPAGEWSGEQLTGAGRYTSSAHPMTAATATDSSLQDFLEDYPASYEGLVELRIYLGAPGRSIDSVSYAATDIQVKGDTWRELDGGASECGNGGKSVAVESLLLPPSDLQPSASASAQPAHPSPIAASAPVSSPEPIATTAQAETHSSNRALLIGIVIAVILLAIGGTYFTRRQTSVEKS